MKQWVGRRQAFSMTAVVICFGLLLSSSFAQDCPELLRAIKPDVQKRLDAEMDLTVLAIHRNEIDQLSRSLGYLEQFHSLPVMRHLALLVPLLILRPQSDLSLLSKIFSSLQKQEWILLQDIVSGGISVEIDVDDFLKALEEVNYLRAGTLDNEGVESLWDNIESFPVSMGESEWQTELHSSYIHIRSLLSFSELPNNFKEAKNMQALIASDLQSPEHRLFAIFFSKIVYSQIELAARKGSAIYTVFAGLWKEHEVLALGAIDRDEASQLFNSMDIQLSDSEPRLHSEANLEMEDSREEALSDELDFSTIAGIPNHIDGGYPEDPDQEAYDEIEGVLNDIYNLRVNPRVFTVDHFKDTPGFRSSLLYEAFYIKDDDPDSSSEMYLTPMQLLILAGATYEALQLQAYLVENRHEAGIWMIPPHPSPLVRNLK